VGCDVVVITVCSLRRDHLGSYGSTAGLTPNLDRLAAAGMRFDAAYAASNFTLPSLTSVFTGQFPSTTGVLNWDRGIGTGVPLLAEVFGYYGYTTGAFTTDAPSGFRPEFGLDRGFQRFRVSTAPNGTPDGRHTTTGGDAAPAARNAADWIRAQPTDRPLLAVYHDRNAHYPYVVAPPTAGGDPTGVRAALWAEGLDGGGQGHIIGKDPVAVALEAGGAAGAAVWRDTYAEAVARMDAGLGELLAAVDARGRRDRTIVVVVADHGESLNEHDERIHGISYFDPVVHVPLLIDAPGAQDGAATAALASHVDLFPTLAELVGVPAPAGIDGVSLAPVLRGAAASVRSTTLVEGGVLLDRPESLRGALISPPWALLLQPPASASGPPTPGLRAGALEAQLYHLVNDPLQTTNVAADHPDIEAGLRARWEGFRAARAGRAAPTELLHDPAFIELLQRTGYDFRPTAAPTP
jgi:arylsulfatase A-like enzyme